jgi:hypothetical protein
MKPLAVIRPSLKILDIQARPQSGMMTTSTAVATAARFSTELPFEVAACESSAREGDKEAE